MKKLYFSLLLLCLGAVANAQTCSTYGFTPFSGTFRTITGTGSSTTGISGDDVSQTGLSLGFTFNFCGSNYTTVSVCSNGWLSLNNSSDYSYVNGITFTGGPYYPSNSTGFLMAFWDDLWGAGHTAYYQTSGTAPYRTFTFEWSNWGLFADYTHYANFQIVLYETTNQIDYIYGTSSYPSRTATIGLTNSTSDYYVLNNGGTSPSPSSSTFTTNINTLPTNGQVYRWNPAPAACSGTPSAGTATAAPSTICGSTTVSLSLIGYTILSGVTYQWQRSTDGTTWSNISGATNTTASTTMSAPNYFRCNVTCTTSSLTGSSAYVFVPYLSGCYCTPTFTRAFASCDSLNISIINFHVNGTASTSINDVAHCSGTGYSDRTSLSVSLFDGASYTATIMGNASYPQNAQTWIDFNDDFTFQATESVGGVNSFGSSSTFTLAIPSGSSLGTHRMRVLSNRSTDGHSYASMDPCASSGYAFGEARDYTVVIYPVCTGTPTAGTASTSASPVCPAASFTVSVTGYTVAAGIVFQWQSSPDNATWTNISGATNTSYTATESSTTYFRCLVTCTNSSVTTPSSSTVVTYLATCYCTPSYSVACGANTTITYFQLAGTSSTLLNDVAGCIGSYQNRTSLSVSLLAGSSSTAYIGGGTTSQNVQAWIDFDDNGTFAATESVGGVNSYTTSGSFTVSISSGAATGTHRMRVVTSRASDGHTYSSLDPCTTGYLRGEARDYTVNIVANTCTGTPSAGVVSVSVASSCSSFTSTLTAVGHSTAPFTRFKWESSPDSTTWTTVAGATSSAYSATVSSGTVFYRFVDSCAPSGLAGRSAGVRLQVNTVPSVAAIGVATVDSVCVGSSILFTDATSGGTWSITNPSLAAISTGGSVTGIVQGIDTVLYSVTNGCGTTTVQQAMRVLPLPNAGSLSGPASVCETASITITPTVSGGTWSALNTNATVSGGVVTGVTAGTDSIFYSVTNSCGTIHSSAFITIQQAPNAGSLSGAATVCETATTTLTVTGAVAGATTWSVTTGNASVSGGIVTGVNPGVDTIRYTATNSCGSDTASHIVTVNPLPHAGTISGPVSVCETVSIILASTISGGVWTASNTHASVAGDTVTGVTFGIDTIFYSVSNSCGTDVASYPVTVNAAPRAGTISGSSTVCEAGTTGLTTSGTTGGTWSASNANASVSSSGTVMGLVPGGVDTIYYTHTNSCGTDVASKVVTVIGLPHAGAITGPTSVCETASISLSTSGSGGAWSMSNTRATVTSTGDVTGVTAGVDTARYIVSNTCGSDTARYTVNINPAPHAGTIFGSSTVCEASTASMGITGSGGGGTGAWSTAIGYASVVSTGVVTGVSAGVDTVKYTYTNGCGVDVAVHVITVNPLPDPGLVSGAASVCVGDSVLFTTTGTGGTWRAGTGHIRVSSAGWVTGIAAGTSIVSYTVSNSCGTRSDTAMIVVNPIPVAGFITGPSSVCEGGARITLSSSATGGTWNVTNANATISSTGNVTGVTAGRDTVIYTVTNVCGTATATRPVTINPLPYAGTITAATTFVCEGSSITYVDTTRGGTWSSASTSVANVGSTTGIVSGVAAGTTFISYSVTNGCGTASASLTVTVNPLPVGGTITGPANGCLGSSVALANASGTPGGTWSSSNVSVATVDVFGNVYGAATGTAVITYMVTTATCGSAFATFNITINPIPYAGTISGPTTVCRASNITLINTGGSASGRWSSSSIAIAPVSATTGVVSGAAVGTATITFTASTVYCGTVYSTYTVTVLPLPVAGTITGPAVVCEAASVTLTNPTGTAGGNWTSANTAIATISSGGIVTGVSAGTVNISYTAVTASCGSATTTYSMTVNPLPRAGTITGVPGLCPGTTTTLVDASSGGTWVSTNRHSSHAGGVITGINAGIDTVGYSVTNSCGTRVATMIVTIYPIPTGGTISGPSSICAGSVDVFTNTEAGGLWSVSSSSVATIDAGSGMVTGIRLGTVTVSYVVTNFCGTAQTTRSLTVNPVVTPSVSIPVTPGSSVCVGDVVTFTANPVAGGSGPRFTWRNGGVYAGIGSTYTYSPSNGDIITCEMVSNASCITTSTVTSPATVMVVNPIVTPAITITSSPGDTARGWGAVINFTATAINGGSSPAFQWYVSGAIVPGATSASFSHAFYGTETVHCELTSSAPCVTQVTVMSNVRAIIAVALGVNKVVKLSGLSLYPNPNTGSFTLTASSDEAFTFDVIDVLGKVVQSGKAIPQNGAVDMQVSLDEHVVPGHYVFRAHTAVGTEYIHFVKGE